MLQKPLNSEVHLTGKYNRLVHSCGISNVEMPKLDAVVLIKNWMWPWGRLFLILKILATNKSTLCSWSPVFLSGFFTQLHKLCSLQRSFLHFHFISAVHMWFISYIINALQYCQLCIQFCPNCYNFRKKGNLNARVFSPNSRWYFENRPLEILNRPS